MRYNFMNDYNECAHERILEAIARVNREQDDSYGLDSRSASARADSGAARRRGERRTFSRRRHAG